jgi:hypothetical protein
MGKIIVVCSTILNIDEMSEKIYQSSITSLFRPPGFLSELEYLYLWEISETYEYFVGRR